MIRIYFDWNVISNLKRTEFAAISQFISDNKSSLQFPYSPAHFNDLMKSYSPQNELFFQDLNTLENLSGKHLLRWEDNRTMPLWCTPKEYFEHEKEKEDIISLMDMDKLLSDLDGFSQDFGIGNVGELIKSGYKAIPAGIEVTAENNVFLQKIFPGITSESSMWDVIKNMAPFSKNLLRNREYYKDFRKTLNNNGFKVDDNSGNWSEDIVFEKVSAFLQKMKIEMTFMQYVEKTLKSQKGQYNRHQFFVTAYLLLDMIGYKSDKLPKSTDSMQNILNDSEHAFYGAHCDFFVASDKKLLTKANVLYKELNISTIVISPDKLISLLEPLIHKVPKYIPNLFHDIIKCVKKENIIDSYSENDIETYVIKIRYFFFDFFNYLIFQMNPKQNLIYFTFKRIFTNYSDFVYFSEVESIFDSLGDLLDYSGRDDFNVQKNEFIHKNKGMSIIWHFKDGKIILNQDKDEPLPIISFVLETDKDELYEKI